MKLSLDLLFEGLALSLGNFGRGWQLTPADSRSGDPFDHLQLAHLPRLDEGDCLAALSHPRGSPDAVNVRLWFEGDIKVHDECDIWNVEATRRDVCRYQHVDAPAPELAKRLFPDRLAHVTVEPRRVVGAAAKILRQLVDHPFGSAKDQRAFGCPRIQNF